MNRLELASAAIGNPKYTPEYIQADFALYLSQVLKARVQESINTQKVAGVPMKTLYKPLNKAYAKSKPYGYKTKFWVNTRHLVDNLTVWRTGTDIRIGFKGKAYYPGTRTRVLKVVLWMEKGTKKMPARPLFIPHARVISKNVAAYFDRYLALKYGVHI